MAKEKDEIRVQVHYIAATQPLQLTLPPSATLASVKAEALNKFELVETDQKKYKLFHKKDELTNLSQTVGEITDDKHELKLDLEEFITQG